MRTPRRTCALAAAWPLGGRGAGKLQLPRMAAHPSKADFRPEETALRVSPSLWRARTSPDRWALPQRRVGSTGRAGRKAAARSSARLRIPGNRRPELPKHSMLNQASQRVAQILIARRMGQAGRTDRVPQPQSRSRPGWLLDNSTGFASSFRIFNLAGGCARSTRPSASRDNSTHARADCAPRASSRQLSSSLAGLSDRPPPLSAG